MRGSRSLLQDLLGYCESFVSFYSEGNVWVARDDFEKSFRHPSKDIWWKVKYTHIVYEIHLCLGYIWSFRKHHHYTNFLNFITTSLHLLPKSVFFPLCIYFLLYFQLVVLAFSRKPLFIVLLDSCLIIFKYIHEIFTDHFICARDFLEIRDSIT